MAFALAQMVMIKCATIAGLAIGMLARAFAQKVGIARPPFRFCGKKRQKQHE
jgi:hypothetical protein